MLNLKAFNFWQARYLEPPFTILAIYKNNSIWALTRITIFYLQMIPLLLSSGSLPTTAWWGRSLLTKVSPSSWIQYLFRPSKSRQVKLPGLRAFTQTPRRAWRSLLIRRRPREEERKRTATMRRTSAPTSPRRRSSASWLPTIAQLSRNSARNMGATSIIFNLTMDKDTRRSLV